MCPNARLRKFCNCSCCKPEGRGFEIRWSEWIFSMYLRPHWALGFTQPLTEMSTRSSKIMFLGSKVWPARRADYLTAICDRLSRQCGILNVSQPCRRPRAVTMIALYFFLLLMRLNQIINWIMVRISVNFIRRQACRWMEAVGFSETSGFLRTTLRYNSEHSLRFGSLLTVMLIIKLYFKIFVLK
jgi:hypothetical protein